MSGAPPLRVPVHYDFASTVCYVAHRVMERMAPSLEELTIELDWIPIDLTQITGYPRGMLMPELRRDNARRIAAELGVAVEPPPVWPDSRPLGAAALIARGLGREASWRERVWTALFEERRDAPDLEGTVLLARDLALELPASEFEDAGIDLDAITQAAAEAQVTGVPTFMLGRWPFGGIQSERTMSQVFERFAQKTRAGGLS